MFGEGRFVWARTDKQLFHHTSISCTQMYPGLTVRTLHFCKHVFIFPVLPNLHQTGKSCSPLWPPKPLHLKPGEVVPLYLCGSGPKAACSSISLSHVFSFANPARKITVKIVLPEVAGISMASSAGQTKATSHAAQRVQLPASAGMQSTLGWRWGNGGQSLCILVGKVWLIVSSKFKQK